MLIYDKYNVKVYAAPIVALHKPSLVSGKTEQRIGKEAERQAVESLIRETFPQSDMQIGHLPSGAPFLIGGDLEISITHCREMAAIALAPKGMRIGIDCESRHRQGQLERVKSRFLSPQQSEKWSRYPASLLAWSAKEALYKAALTPGLPLEEIPLPECIPYIETAPDCSVEIAGRRYHLLQLPEIDKNVVGVLVFAKDIAEYE